MFWPDCSCDGHTVFYWKWPFSLQKTMKSPSSVVMSVVVATTVLMGIAAGGRTILNYNMTEPWYRYTPHQFKLLGTKEHSACTPAPNY